MVSAAMAISGQLPSGNEGKNNRPVNVHPSSCSHLRISPEKLNIVKIVDSATSKGKLLQFPLYRQNTYFPERCHLVLSEPDRARFGLNLYHQPAIIGWGVWPQDGAASCQFPYICSKVIASAPISHLPYQGVSPDCTLGKNSLSLEQLSFWNVS